jgi:hypothetical protein
MAYGGDDLRCMKDRYNYFVRGRKIILIEWKNSTASDDVTGCEPDYQPPAANSDTLTGANTGKKGITNGLLLQITAIPDLSELLNEKDDVPVNDVLAMAMVDYIKAQLVEDPKDQGKQLYYMQRFKDRVAKYNSRKVGGARIVGGTGYMR